MPRTNSSSDHVLGSRTPGYNASSAANGRKSSKGTRKTISMDMILLGRHTSPSHEDQGKLVGHRRAPNASGTTGRTTVRLAPGVTPRPRISRHRQDQGRPMRPELSKAPVRRSTSLMKGPILGSAQTSMRADTWQRTPTRNRTTRRSRPDERRASSPNRDAIPSTGQASGSGAERRALRQSSEPNMKSMPALAVLVDLQGCWLSTPAVRMRTRLGHVGGVRKPV